MKISASFGLVLCGLLAFTACQGPLLPEQATNSIASNEQPVTLSRSALPNTAPVILESARITYQRNAAGNLQAKLVGIVDLKNLAYAKTLTLHYLVSSSSTWADLNGTFLATSTNGYEQWKFETAYQPFSDVLSYRFDLKYTVNGNVYWDNNNGKDYSLQVGVGFNTGAIYDMDHGVLNNGQIILNKVGGTFNPNGGIDLGVSAMVKNLAYQKTVQIVYTTDNWVTSQTLTASYSRSLENSVEQWNSPIFHVAAGVPEIKFALSYTVAGQTYWDNNRGANYTFNFTTLEM